MDISEYRARFASFNSTLELVRFHNHVGLTSDLTINEVYDQHSDSFSADAISELRSFREQIPDSQETQKIGLSKLIASACVRFCEASTREVNDELLRCERASAIHWRGETIPLDEIPFRLGKEPNKELRRDLAARWFDSVNECNDLRVARLSTLDEAASLLGFESFSQLPSETAIGVLQPGVRREQAINSLLRQTESNYNVELSKLLPREVRDLSRDELEIADLPYLESMPWLDRYYKASQFFRIQWDMMRGLGIKVDQQRGIQWDSQPRPARKRCAACFAVAPPNDVRVAMLPQDSVADFLNSIECFGKAQFLSWCSPDLAVRNPEFIYSTDTATSRAYAYLFRYLATDVRWHLDFVPGIAEAEVVRIVRDHVFDLTLQARRLCALAEYENDVCLNKSLPEETILNYEATFMGAISFKTRSGLYLVELQNGAQPLTKLRALAFSFVLREYLRVRFGHRWWTSRKAGDELIDLWSTSSRYAVEELSSSLGFGDLSLDLLAEVINSGLSGE